MRNGTTTPGADWTPERLAAVSRNIGITVIAGVVLGLFAAAANLYYIAAIIGAATLALVIAWQFEAALALYVIVAFVPWGQTPDLAVGGSGMGKGVFVSQIMLGFLLVIWFAKYLFAALPADRIRSGFYVPLALYLAYSILNVANAFVFWDPHVNRMYQHPTVNAIEVGLRVLSAGALIMMATSISSKAWLKWTTLAVFLPGFYHLVNGLSGAGIPVQAPWWPLVALLPVCYALAIALDADKGWLKRAAGAAVVAGAVLLILVKGVSWISGWLGLIVALGAVALIKSRKMFAVAAVVAAAAAVVFWPVINENVIVESQRSGDYDRFALMRGGWKYATTFPLGVGLGNYRTYNVYYGDKWGTTAYSSAHSTYAQHLSEMGIPGFVLFVAVLVGGFAWMLKSYAAMPRGMSRTYLLAAMGQMAGIACAACIGDYIIPTYHNGGLVTFSATVYSWLIWGLAVAHVRIPIVSESNGPVSIDS